MELNPNGKQDPENLTDPQENNGNLPKVPPPGETPPAESPPGSPEGETGTPPGETPPEETPPDPQARIAELENLLSERDTRITELAAQANQLVTVENKLHMVESEFAIVTAQAKAGQTALTAALEKYTAKVRETNADIPGDMITGNTFDEVDLSLDKARTLVKRIREAAPAPGSPPAGAPPRQPIDLESLSPRDKIKAGMAQK